MNEFIAFVSGALLTAVVILIAGDKLGIKERNTKALYELAQCEKDLPRDQYCKLTAIPETK